MTNQDDRIPFVTNDENEYLPAGERQGVDASFTADAVAGAFGVEIDRVQAAFQGEFDRAPDATVDSREAQHLAEMLMADQPLDAREAALMRLGAFTPRPDHEFGFGEKPPHTESDWLVRRGDQGDEERG